MAVRTFDTDVPDAVLEFLDEAVSGRGREHWRWKYRVGTRQPDSAFYWQADDGRVLGFIGLMRTTLKAAGECHDAAWFVDWHVRPGGQGVGVGIGLLRKAEAAAGMLMTLQGSADTQKILPRLGWKLSFSPSTWVLPLGSRFLSAWLAQRFPRLPSGLARVIGTLAAPYYRCRPPSVIEDLELIDIERFPAEYDRVWKARSLEFAPAMRRDSDYVNYLCVDYPEGGYRLQLLNLAGATVGHLISRVDIDRAGLKRGRIVDLVWPKSEPRLASWLIASASVQLRELQADYVECLASRADLQAALRANRFRARRNVPIWYHRLAPGAPDPDDWYITFLDCDRAYR